MKITIEENGLIRGIDNKINDTDAHEALDMFIECMKQCTFDKSSIESAIVKRAKKIKKESISKELTYDDAITNQSVDNLLLSVRAQNILNNAEIETIGQLCSHNAYQLMKARNMGRKTLDEIEEKLAYLGLKLAGGEAEPLRLNARGFPRK